MLSSSICYSGPCDIEVENPSEDTDFPKEELSPIFSCPEDDKVNNVLFNLISDIIGKKASRCIERTKWRKYVCDEKTSEYVKFIKNLIETQK
jgi:hypothetical protein